MSIDSDAHVILLAHGSSDPNWQATFEALSKPSREALPQAVIGYMELCEPSLERQIAHLKQQGATRIKIVPLFLARGRHLRKDVPDMLETYAARYDIVLELTPPVGEHPALAQSIRDIVDDIVGSERPV
jgi:sirohydrochlorin cobaltochelatase